MCRRFEYVFVFDYREPPLRFFNGILDRKPSQKVSPLEHVRNADCKQAYRLS